VVGFHILRASPPSVPPLCQVPDFFAGLLPIFSANTKLWCPILPLFLKNPAFASPSLAAEICPRRCRAYCFALYRRRSWRFFRLAVCSRCSVPFGFAWVSFPRRPPDGDWSPTDCGFFPFDFSFATPPLPILLRYFSPEHLGQALCGQPPSCLIDGKRLSFRKTFAFFPPPLGLIEVRYLRSRGWPPPVRALGPPPVPSFLFLHDWGRSCWFLPILFSPLLPL